MHRHRQNRSRIRLRHWRLFTHKLTFSVVLTIITLYIISCRRCSSIDVKWPQRFVFAFTAYYLKWKFKKCEGRYWIHPWLGVWRVPFIRSLKKLIWVRFRFKNVRKIIRFFKYLVCFWKSYLHTHQQNWSWLRFWHWWGS